MLTPCISMKEQAIPLVRLSVHFSNAQQWAIFSESDPYQAVFIVLYLSIYV